MLVIGEKLLSLVDKLDVLHRAHLRVADGASIEHLAIRLKIHCFC